VTYLNSPQVSASELHKLTTQTFLTVIESGPESFGAFAPDIQGCIAFSVSREEVMQLFKSAAEAHLIVLAEADEILPTPDTTEIPGLSIGIPTGAITLEWTTVTLPSAAPSAHV
jgi:predicted RNase H-like HicB family nuclease